MQNPIADHHQHLHQQQEQQHDDGSRIPGSFFVQGDWYGKHRPWRRIAAFVMLSTWSWTASTLVSRKHYY